MKLSVVNKRRTGLPKWLRNQLTPLNINCFILYFLNSFKVISVLNFMFKVDIVSIKSELLIYVLTQV